MGTTQQPNEFCLEDLVIGVPWLAKPQDEKCHSPQTSNVVSLDQYRREREKQQNNRDR
jgi:hypothetical protein